MSTTGKHYIERQLKLEWDMDVTRFDMLLLEKRFGEIMQVYACSQDILCQGEENLGFLFTSFDRCRLVVLSEHTLIAETIESNTANLRRTIAFRTGTILQHDVATNYTTSVVRLRQ